jgi:NAD(P)H dehydrogenase (quinone)
MTSSRAHRTQAADGKENAGTRIGHILVLYFSRDGHTKMMAELVAEGAGSVPLTEVRLKTVAEATADDLMWCDGIAAGSPTHMGTIAWEMKQWWDVTAQPLWPKVDGKIGCAFSSSGGLSGGGELTCLALQIVMMNYGMLVFGVPDYVAPGQTLHYGAICAGRPRNEGDREACRRLGRRLCEWVQTLICHRPEYSPLKTSYPRFPPE